MSEQAFFCICGALLGFIAGAAAVAAYYTLKESRGYVEPDTTTDTTKTPEVTTKCDREALLALAEEAKKNAWYYALDHPEDELRDRLAEAEEDFSDMARRIREALGVDDG